MILPYKFYYKENAVLKIQYFRTLKEIKLLLKENAIIPMQINKYSSDEGYTRFKVWDLIL